MNRLRSGLRRASFIICLAYAYGAILGVIGLVWEWMFQPVLPSWKWWQFLLAPLAIGLIALALEGVGQLIRKSFGTDNANAPKWKRNLGLLVIFVLMTALVLGPAFYRIAHQ